jgi:hypothetical protein
MSLAGINKRLGKRWWTLQPRSGGLQLRWWPLPDLSAAPLKRPAIDVFFNFGDGHCWTRWQHPTWGPPSMSSSTSVVVAPGHVGSTLQGAAIDVFNFGGGRCWTRRQHPPRGPPSTSSSTSMVAAARPASSTPKGPIIDVFFIFGGGCCRTCRQLPHGARHRRLLQLRWWPLLDPSAAPPKGPAINVFSNFGGSCCRIHR